MRSADPFWTESLRYELEEHVTINIDSITSAHRNDGPSAEAITLDVSDFIGSLKEIVRYTTVVAIPDIARSGQFDGATFDSDDSEMLGDLDSWIENNFAYQDATHQKYVSGLLTAILHPPASFNFALQEQFGAEWASHKFDEVYDEYYVQLAHEWLILTSANVPPGLEIVE
ncbi:hypothetical protein [Candidatus Poriferisodalis sp.]|uniref:hypothetical protein n=1 Tax=Candidatus Poriferisodalis sp. TaxID=3101277 RepID=UPI003B01BF7D